MTETVAWLTTVGADGTPQPNPIWFIWDGADTVVIYSVEKAKPRHVAANPRVALHFNTAEDGDDVVIFTGSAMVDRNQPLVGCHERAIGEAGRARCLARPAGKPGPAARNRSLPCAHIRPGRIHHFKTLSQKTQITHWTRLLGSIHTFRMWLQYDKSAAFHAGVALKTHSFATVSGQFHPARQ